MPAAAAWPAWPEYALHDDLLPTLSAWHRAGQRVALATLVEVRGSSPRPRGSPMAISRLTPSDHATARVGIFSSASASTIASAGKAGTI